MAPFNSGRTITFSLSLSFSFVLSASLSPFIRRSLGRAASAASTFFDSFSFFFNNFLEGVIFFLLFFFLVSKAIAGCRSICFMPSSSLLPIVYRRKGNENGKRYRITAGLERDKLPSFSTELDRTFWKVTWLYRLLEQILVVSFSFTGFFFTDWYLCLPVFLIFKYFQMIFK